ncbi:hypothetical protein A4G18_02210 [Pasteurellaceae bacterium Pebbles2]|nr:hypothetical protein [Pasteurellaceae bacterium Pebbles2]
MKFKKSTLSLAILTAITNFAYAGGVRHDIDVQTYRDFGENKGSFLAGAENVPVYRADGSLSGHIKKMPDFSMVADGGYATIIAPSFIGSTYHVNYTENMTFAARHLTNDRTLFNVNNKQVSGDFQQPDADVPKPPENSTYALFGEWTRKAADINLQGDYKITRTRNILWEAEPMPMLTDSSKLKQGALLARTGGGVHAKLLDVAKTENLGYGWLNGGLALVDRISQEPKTQNHIAFQFDIHKTPDTALDSISFQGDSGSPLYLFNEEKNKWELAGFLSEGLAAYGYGKISIGKSATQHAKTVMDYYNSHLTVNTTFAREQLQFGIQRPDGNVTLTHNGKSTTLLGLDNNKTNWSNNIDLVLGGAGGTLNISQGDVNLGSSAVVFNNNFTLTGDKHLNSAGYIVNENATVISQLNGKQGDTWRKIGKGTLVIAGNGDQQAELNVGDGLVELNRTGGYAAHHIRLASGRGTVKLMQDNQIRQQDGEIGFAFGTKAGKLDLNNHSLKWDNILHIDSHPVITNSQGVANFTFTGNNFEKNLTYLGQFTDESGATLNLIYEPENNDHSWTLKGNATTSGEFDIKKSRVNLTAPFVLHANNYVDESEYQRADFHFAKVNVAENSQLSVARNTQLNANTTLNNNATLTINTAGIIKDSAQYLNEGTRISGQVHLAPTAKINANIAEHFVANLDANLSGNGELNLNNSGTLSLNGDNRPFQGKIKVDHGILNVTNNHALSENISQFTLTSQATLNLAQNVHSTLSTIQAEKSSVIQGNGNSSLTINNSQASEILSDFSNLSQFTKTGNGHLTTALLKADEVKIQQGLLTPTSIQTKTILLDSQGTLQLNGNIQGDLTHKGRLIIGADQRSQTPTTTYEKITLDGNYIGENGTIFFDSQLGNDQSPTDKLHIKGSTSGQAQVNINYVGSGDQTISGIPLITVDGKSEAKFSNSGRVVVGAYDYLLKPDAAGNWVLTNRYLPWAELVPATPTQKTEPVPEQPAPSDTSAQATDKPSEPSTPATPENTAKSTPPNAPILPENNAKQNSPNKPISPENSAKSNSPSKIAPPEVIKPNESAVHFSQDFLRAEFGAYLANNEMTMRSLRAGSVLSQLAMKDRLPNSVNVWTSAQTERNKFSIRQHKIHSDTRYNETQLGADIKLEKTYLGVNIGKGVGSGDSHSFASGVVANNRIKSTTVGLYAAYFEQNEYQGAYFATQAKYGWYQNRVRAPLIENHYRSNAFSINGEMGYAFALNENLSLRPKMALEYRRILDKKLTDKASQIQIGQSNLITSAGAEFVAHSGSLDGTIGAFYEHHSQPSRVKISDKLATIESNHNALKIQVGGRWHITPAVDVNAQFEWQNSTMGYRQKAAKLGISYRF